MAYQRIVTRTRIAGGFLYSDEVVEKVRSCRFEFRRSGGSTWARLRLAREFHQASEFTRGDEYCVFYKSGDMRFRGRIASVQRTAKGGEIEILLHSSLKDLDRIYPLFPSNAQSFQNHPDQADISYWIKAILDEHIVPDTDIIYRPEDITETGVIIERPILDRKVSTAQMFHLFSVAAGFAVWGIDTENNFYFKPRTGTVGPKYHIGVDRGWGAVENLQEDLVEPVNCLRIAGEIPAELNDDGEIQYPASPALFRKEYTRTDSISDYGRNCISVHAPGLRCESLSDAIASNFLNTHSNPGHKFMLNVNGISEELDPGRKVMLYDEAGTRIGGYFIGRIIYCFNENSKALIELGQWPVKSRFRFQEESEVFSTGEAVLGGYPLNQ